MKVGRVLGIAGFVAGFATAAPAIAHHSYAQFDRCTDSRIEGTVAQISWSNPHIVMLVDAVDGITYRVEWLALNQLEREGLSTDALTAGDRVAIMGALNKNPELHVLTLLSEIEVAARDWKWRRARATGAPSRPAACAAETEPR